VCLHDNLKKDGRLASAFHFVNFHYPLMLLIDLRKATIPLRTCSVQTFNLSLASLCSPVNFRDD
jgi:hypothetical protein